ncbi:MAG: alkaline phosphatase [Bacteroidaceae bacterium]|nr:alkaline phosphatase [Bacteroidaceae bacterium]
MKKLLLLMIAICLVSSTRGAVDPQKVKPVKNVILMVTDGTSISAVSLARWLQYYQNPDMPNLNLDPYLCGTVRTSCSDAPIGDSAPTTSCYVTGHMSRCSYVATFPPDRGKDNIDIIDGSKAYGPMATLLEAGKQLQGKSAGMVFTCQFPHATPADCSSHYYNRSAYDILSEQQVHNGLDVVIGGGNNYLNQEQEEYLKNHGYSVFRNDKKGMETCTNNKMWALYGGVDMEYDIDRNPDQQPSLAEMAKIALDKLSKNKKGFFLLIEGSKVDYAAHSNDAAAIGPEFLAFDQAFGVALEFAKKDKNTVIVVVPDHGNSGLSIGCSRCGDYSHRSKDNLFGQLSKYKRSAGVLTNLVKEQPYEKLQDVLTQYEGLELTADDVDRIVHAKDYDNSPIPKDARKGGSLYSILKDILTLHTCLGWTTGGHTGEEVFLACYNPHDIRPLGMSTNVELGNYLLACFGLYGKMDQFTDKIFTHHDVAFKGMDWSIEKPEKGFPVLTVKNPSNGKTMTIRAHGNLAKVDGKEIEIASVMPYVDRTDKFYVPNDMAKYLK